MKVLIITDENECVSGDPCGNVDHTSCMNTDGGFACVCVSGYTYNDTRGRCEGKLHPENRVCVNTEGAVACPCKPGYTYNDTSGRCEGKLHPQNRDCVNT